MAEFHHKQEWFNLEKATELVSTLLRLYNDQMSISHMNLLLYLSDRESIKKIGHPMTTDAHYMSSSGPILYHVSNRAKSLSGICDYWSKYIKPIENNYISAICNPPNNHMSEVEADILTGTYFNYPIYKEDYSSAKWINHNMPESLSLYSTPRVVPLLDIYLNTGYDQFTADYLISQYITYLDQACKSHTESYC